MVSKGNTYFNQKQLIMSDSEFSEADAAAVSISEGSDFGDDLGDFVADEVMH